MSEFEITALVLSEHEVFRRDFVALDELSGAALAQAWQQLAARLEVHAVGEEELFYPLLAREAEDGVQETEDAVRDHNGIRTAARAVEEQEPGSEQWWAAVRATQEVNAEHMAEEERDFLPGFREAVDPERREELGMQWLAFHDEHEQARGLSGDDADPAKVAGTA